MTRAQAATLLQLRWRQLKAHRVAALWAKVERLNAGRARGGAGEGQGGAAAESSVQDVPLAGGWVQRTSKKTGAVYFVHLASGKSQWVEPEARR